MSDEYEHKLEAKSDYVSDGSYVPTTDIDSVREAELPDQELYHSHSWWTTYVFSQDGFTFDSGPTIGHRHYRRYWF